MDSGPLLIALAIICFCLFFLRTLMIAYRFYMLKQLKEAVQVEQARRDIEVSISNNALNTGTAGGVVNTTCGNGIVCAGHGNDMTILPKGMDLPPSYDELTYNNEVKQQNNIGASMLTITTDLDSSNPNLATAFNEPPPDYVELGTTTTTTTTTVVVNTRSLPDI